MSALKKRCSRAHWEPVVRDNGASPYCMKEETRVEGPWEFGEEPVKMSSKTDWEEVWKKATTGKLMDIPANIRVAHYSKLKMISKDHTKVTGESADVKGLWICGPSGCGKSRYARDTYPGLY